jgi:multiple sugar transport system permease protein
VSVTAPTAARRATGPTVAPRRRPRRVLLPVLLTIAAVIWLVPLVWSLYTSLRTYEDTTDHGYFSVSHSLTFVNYRTAWTAADLPHYFRNTMLIAIPAIVIVLFLASFVAFALSRFTWWFNVPLLMLFTAGNLLPQQILIMPLYEMYKRIALPTFLSDSGQLYDSYVGIILIHVAFQSGFCVFVLSNFMKTIPRSLTEAAVVDGASVWKQFWHIVLPLTRPALAALATLEFTWIYNDFFWALVLQQTGSKRPITSALANLQGSYFTNDNLVAAASLMTAVPTVVVFLVLSKQFISGLTLGADKG